MLCCVLSSPLLLTPAEHMVATPHRWQLVRVRSHLPIWCWCHRSHRQGRSWRRVDLVRRARVMNLQLLNIAKEVWQRGYACYRGRCPVWCICNYSGGGRKHGGATRSQDIGCDIHGSVQIRQKIRSLGRFSTAKNCSSYQGRIHRPIITKKNNSILCDQSTENWWERSLGHEPITVDTDVRVQHSSVRLVRDASQSAYRNAS